MDVLAVARSDKSRRWVDGAKHVAVSRFAAREGIQP